MKYILIFLLLASSNVLADTCNEYRVKYQCPGTDKKPIHLSFDDGPADLTPSLLDTLHKERIPATFFVLAERIDCQRHRPACVSGDQSACTSYNYCLEHRNTLKRIKKEGHTIGSHSYSHIRHSTVPAAEMEQQIVHSKQLLSPFLNTSPALFRLPYGDGWFNRNTSTLVLDTLKKHGFQHLAWEMSAYDWREADQQGDKILQTIMKEICTKHGGVILLHDGDHEKEYTGRTFTGEHLAEWIPAMRCVADFKPLSYFYKDLLVNSGFKK